MKPFIVIYLVLMCLACTGTKKVPEVSQKKHATIDSVSQTVIDAVKNTEALATPKNLVQTSTQDATPFITPKQILKKRFLGTHDQWDTLLKRHVSTDGKVNYKGFKTDYVKLLSYIKSLQATYNAEAFQEFNSNQKLAFWINAYNAFTIDLILRHYPVKSIKDIKNPWEARYWKLGETWINLNEIEHTILRKMNEPRIHFAIVCASVSCPKLLNEAFKADSLNAQLTKATNAFLNDSTKNQITSNELKLSKIFKWFAKDFKTNNTDLIDFLNTYSEVQITPHVKKSYLEYNWSLNE
ncbi:hypothetical protein PK35_14255 [Tamlana nanhaiensis]|uniref:DUF547 domain-containing protein n=1 Tax=Neotamlana nanhaiensis TaxID=1382798 RepID=A0A0D7VXP6_9FLAO|nr:DUF547 domain-containing protein [Tamlana nanhaiensis]KJD31564.1 hypothetical protein PK35_14255 [Tamlana nanhaiensis]